MGLDMTHLSQWIGRSETQDERLAPFPANALAATLNRNDPLYLEGAAIPPLWHWLYFLAISPLSQTGPDGHPARGGFVPPVPLPRRMWAGSRLVFLKPLLIGDMCRRISTVTRVEHKTGKSGDLVFVTVRHEIAGERGPAIEEEHDIVYREAATPGAVPPPDLAAPAEAEWSFPVTPDPVLLFRYSALTFNSHRIHYDLDYATNVEAYPGLVVHGPLIATLLLDGLSRARPQARITRFSFRAIAPTFHLDRFAVHGTLTGPEAGPGKGPEARPGTGPGSARLWVEKGGALTMDGTAEFI